MNENHNKGLPRKTIGGLTSKYKRMAELYAHFASAWKHVLDFSDEAKINLFNNESYGTPISNKDKNGFCVGKHWLNVTVAMWLEDRKDGHLVISDLYEDSNYPKWWLDRIFK